MFTGISFSTFPCVSFLFFRLVRRGLHAFFFCPGRGMRRTFRRLAPFLSMPLFYTPSIYNPIFYSDRWDPGPKISFLKGLCAFYLLLLQAFPPKRRARPSSCRTFSAPFLLFTFPYISGIRPCRSGSCTSVSPPDDSTHLVKFFLRRPRRGGCPYLPTRQVFCAGFMDKRL